MKREDLKIVECTKYIKKKIVEGVKEENLIWVLVRGNDMKKGGG